MLFNQQYLNFHTHNIMRSKPISKFKYNPTLITKQILKTKLNRLIANRFLKKISQRFTDQYISNQSIIHKQFTQLLQPQIEDFIKFSKNQCHDKYEFSLQHYKNLFIIYKVITKRNNFINLIARNQILDTFLLMNRLRQLDMKQFQQFYKTYKYFILPYEIFKSTGYLSKSCYSQLIINQIIEIQTTKQLIENQFLLKNKHSLIIRNKTSQNIGLTWFSHEFKSKYKTITIKQRIINGHNNSMLLETKFEDWLDIKNKNHNLIATPFMLDDFHQIFINVKKMYPQHHNCKFNLLAYIQSLNHFTNHNLIFLRPAFYHLNHYFSEILINNTDNQIVWYTIHPHDFQFTKMFIQLNYNINILQNGSILQVKYMELLDNGCKIKMITQKKYEMFYVSGCEYRWFRSISYGILVSLKFLRRNIQEIENIKKKLYELGQSETKFNQSSLKLKILNHEIQNNSSNEFIIHITKDIKRRLMNQQLNSQKINLDFNVLIVSYVKQQDSFCKICTCQFINYYAKKQSHYICLDCFNKIKYKNYQNGLKQYIICTKYPQPAINQFLETKLFANTFIEIKSLCTFDFIGQVWKCKYHQDIYCIQQYINNIGTHIQQSSKNICNNLLLLNTENIQNRNQNTIKNGINKFQNNKKEQKNNVSNIIETKIAEDKIIFDF